MAGGMITQMLDAIYKLDKTKIISVHHEQTAAFAADASGRLTGKPGIAFATSGPGATNLLTGIGSCYFDSSPAIFITGQVNTHELKGDRPIRQLGFQETDILSMAAPITKKCYKVMHAEEFEACLIDAYRTAISGRPGPVLIDLPMNLQRVEIEVAPIQKIEKIITPSTVDDMDFSHLIRDIKQAKKPLVLLGNGVHCANAEDKIKHLIEQLNVPVVTSLLGLDLLPYHHPLRIGFIGSYGNRWANLAMGNCDLLIVLGSRLDIRQTGADVDFFADKKIYHVDCYSPEINNRLKNCYPFAMDLNEFVERMNQQLSGHSITLQDAWIRELHELKETWPDTEEIKNIKGINPNYLLHELSQWSGKAAGYLADVGNHQMWAAQSLELLEDQFFMTSGGMGAMGFSLPAAIGASLASGGKPVVVIVGDGSFQVNIQELQTIVRNKLPIKIVVLNNHSLGMIRQFQDNYFEGRYQSTLWGYSAPDFAAIAAAYQIPSGSVEDPDDLSEALDALWANPDEPYVLQVMIDTRANAYPKIAFGKPITEMEPFVSPVAMEGT